MFNLTSASHLQTINDRYFFPIKFSPKKSYFICPKGKSFERNSHLDQKLTGPRVWEEVCVAEPGADGEDQRQNDGDGRDPNMMILP